MIIVIVLMGIIDVMLPRDAPYPVFRSIFRDAERARLIMFGLCAVAVVTTGLGI
ncbi:hypothetical protein [Jannaschia sp. LMIT008]|uniref:hypothetical protein n=1 Tax=Jannaschia maritima TaxID=3032585 RepID=UPI0028111EB8|nr:hypothetical protein [Jannaschia sp. LMIT008]